MPITEIATRRNGVGRVECLNLRLVLEFGKMAISDGGQYGARDLLWIFDMVPFF